MMKQYRKPLEPGTVLKGASYSYRIVRTLGQGTYAIAYEAETTITGSMGAFPLRVAVKEFSPIFSGELTESYCEVFRREAENLALLAHPGVVRILELFSANETFYYSMEYIDGGSLEDLVTQRGALPEQEAIKLIQEVGEALSYMHKHGMLHLDVKPGNILLRSDGRPVLIDFGLSHLFGDVEITGPCLSLGGGTPGYFPMEQIYLQPGRRLPATMDVYALGATLYKLLTGNRPPVSTDIYNLGFPEQELLNAGVSEHTVQCVRKAMAPRYSDRFQTVDSFVKALTMPSGKISYKEKATQPPVDPDRTAVFGECIVRKDTVAVLFLSRPGYPYRSLEYEMQVTPRKVILSSGPNSTMIPLPLPYGVFERFLLELSLVLRQRPEVQFIPGEYSEEPGVFQVLLLDRSRRCYKRLWTNSFGPYGNLDSDSDELLSCVLGLLPGVTIFEDIAKKMFDMIKR